MTEALYEGEMEQNTGKAEKKLSEKIRKHFVFTGDVQGVGFRYRAHYAAQMAELTGWVMNRWDGSVEMEVQGPEQEIEQMVIRIAAGTYVDISGREEWRLPIDEEETGFHVRYE